MCKLSQNTNTIFKGIPEDLRLKQSPLRTSGHPFKFLHRPWPKQEEPRPHLRQAPFIPSSQLTAPKKKARISAPAEPSEPSSKPQPPTIESQIPSRMTPELQPELRDSFHLLQRYHLEHLMTPRDFFYARVALDFYQSMTMHRIQDPTVIHFTIDERHEGCLTCSYLLRKELPPSMFFIDALLPQHLSTSAYGAEERDLLEALSGYRGILFSPHHLIMAVLLTLKRRRICQEIFTLNKLTSMTAYDVEPGPQLDQSIQRDHNQTRGATAMRYLQT
ncbi:hypothetical protein CK203_115026 [Vitis vinifera]|uniref:Uncharacterized protein n=1 Tax=Vitis vinifera TaxID=29760 RepID=A0A438BNZ3_VITVI|nr:hypothetical protein CK203_115026 [Vitis vinifera]